MSRESLVVVLGFLLIFVPFLGVLNFYKTYATVAIGIALVLVGYGLRRSRYLRRIERGNGERGNDSFVERFQTRLDYPDTPLQARNEYDD